MFVLHLLFVNFMKFSTVSVVFPKILAVNLVLIEYVTPFKSIFGSTNTVQLTMYCPH